MRGTFANVRFRNKLVPELEGRGRRVGIDPALYTWKGYRNWTEQIRRNWDPETGDDFD